MPWPAGLKDPVRDTVTSLVLDTITRATDNSALLKTVIELCPNEILVADERGRILMANQASRDILGLSETEIIGTNVRHLESKGVIHPSAVALALQMKGPVVCLQSIRGKKEVLMKATPICGAKSGILAVIAVSYDLSEIGELENQLRYKELLVDEHFVKGNQPTGLEKPLDVDTLVMASKSMQRIYSVMERVAAVDCTVLLQGESGVGKEVLARTIHQMSNREGSPFVTVNCGAIPESLFESELFGFKGDSFTGARKDGRTGLIARAHRGTLFLDEVAELPLHMQSKLLRFLQNREILPIGGDKPNFVDTRVIAATNVSLEDRVAKKCFRKDLFYRLNVIPIEVPPLRERSEDIEPLARYFLEKYNKQFDFTKCFSPSVMDILRRWTWPGNVRELQNLIQRVLVISRTDCIEPCDLPDEMCLDGQTQTGRKSLQDAVKSLERGLICSLYVKYKSSYKVAEELGISQSTVVRRLKTYRSQGFLIPRD